MSSNLSTNPNDSSGTMFGGSQTGTSQTNPFTADLKGEFSSSFGTSTNAVSQIFRDGGFVSQARNRYIILGVAVVLTLGVVGYWMFGSSDEEMDFDLPAPTAAVQKPLDSAAPKDPMAAAPAPADAAAPTSSAPATTASTAEVAASAHAAPTTPTGTGAIVLATPQDGATMGYDESRGPAEFAWEGDGSSTIVFSREPSMAAVVRRANTSRNRYAFANPWPGRWYWRVENASGASEVRSFQIRAPKRRNISLTQPAAGSSLSSSGGTVAWNGDAKVTSYRVELSTGDWTNPAYRFGTANTSLAVQGVAAGSYQLRVGAFSEVSGRWEYTNAVPVTVQ